VLQVVYLTLPLATLFTLSLVGHSFTLKGTPTVHQLLGTNTEGAMGDLKVSLLHESSIRMTCITPRRKQREPGEAGGHNCHYIWAGRRWAISISPQPCLLTEL